MIKQFSAGDITTRPFKTFKHWNVQSVDANGQDQFGRSTYLANVGEVNKGTKIDGPFFETGSPKYVALNEPVTPNGKYERVIYSLTDAMFYRNPTSPIEMFGVEDSERDPTTSKKGIRKINDQLVSLRLAKNYWGERILPRSIEITDNSNPHATYEIYDDGATNLYISGSHFGEQTKIGAVNPLPPIPEWDTSVGKFYVVIANTTQSISYEKAKEYMNIGLEVSYVSDGSEWTFAESSSRDYYQPENERFGQSVSAWYKYMAVGSPMDSHSFSDQKQGYAAIYKYDDGAQQHRLIKKFISPQSQNGLALEFGIDNNNLFELENNNFLGIEGTSSYEDLFGYSVSVKDNFFAVGAPTGSACWSSGSGEGFVYMYDRYKGGSDNWGLINVLQGGAENDQFGNSVSIDGDILAVGAPGTSGSIGSVYIFRLKRFMDDAFPCRSISTSSFWHKISDCGLPLVDETGSIIYSAITTPSFASGNFSWEYEATLLSSIAVSGDNFGWTLAASDDRVIVGNRKTNGDGYATLFSCGYISSSLGACPTASWTETAIHRADDTLGDLNKNDPQFSVQTSTVYNGYGWTVGLDNENMIIGSFYDKAFLAYSGAPTTSVSILGAAYFYHGKIDACNVDAFHKTHKTFGGVTGTSTTNFGRIVSIDGQFSAVSSEPIKTNYWVDYTSSLFTIESSSYVAQSATDGVLGKVTMYSLNTDYTWKNIGEIRRNKEANMPFNVFGRGLALSSDFLVVGAPVYNYATGSNVESIYDYGTQISSSMPSQYSGSVFVYDLEDRGVDTNIGNAFYKNGYLVVTNTSSNYQNIFTGTGSSGFEMSYQGTHTIYEHEYLVSIKPGEFNYSTNPSSLAFDPLLFDVNQDGVFDFVDLDLIMRYLHKKRFYEDYVFDDNGIVLEQDNRLESWWNNDILLTEANDVLLQESDFAEYLVGSSFTAFTRTAFDYIENKLVLSGVLDIDGNGVVDLNDGAILAAHFANKLTPIALLSWIDADSTRRYVKDVETYIGKYTGNHRFYTNPEFFGYQYSSSYDPTGSFLAPTITSIGLYDGAELVAVAKLGRPIKNLIDWPINFIVRFDT
jgi:hypothetical protein